LVCRVKRNGYERRCVGGGGQEEELITETRKEKISFVVIILYCGWSVGGASGFVLSQESVPVREAQHISTRQQSSFTRLKTHAG